MPRVFFKMPLVFFQVFVMPSSQRIVKAIFCGNLHTIPLFLMNFKVFNIGLYVNTFAIKYIKIANICEVLVFSLLFSFFFIELTLGDYCLDQANSSSLNDSFRKNLLHLIPCLIAILFLSFDTSIYCKSQLQNL